jgi:hypothetical protein
MRQKRHESHYFSYLLRLWQTRDGDEQVWRASLESPGTGEWRGFGSLAALVAYLEQAMEEQEQSAGDDGELTK